MGFSRHNVAIAAGTRLARPPRQPSRALFSQDLGPRTGKVMAVYSGMHPGGRGLALFPLKLPWCQCRAPSISCWQGSFAARAPLPWMDPCPQWQVSGRLRPASPVTGQGLSRWKVASSVPPEALVWVGGVAWGLRLWCSQPQRRCWPLSSGRCGMASFQRGLAWSHSAQSVPG